MIYLAHPYTTGVTGLSLGEILEKVATFAYLAHQQKIPIYYPVLMGENIIRWAGKEEETTNQEYNFWSWHDRQMLDLCDELWVLDIKGWTESEGVKQEIEYVEKLGKPVFCVAFKESEYRVHVIEPTEKLKPFSGANWHFPPDKEVRVIKK